MTRLYRHYKNNKTYEVVGFAKTTNDTDLIRTDRVFHTEKETFVSLYISIDKERTLFTTEKTDLVIYRDLDGNYWARPKKMFFGKVRHGRKIVQRFMRID